MSITIRPTPFGVCPVGGITIENSDFKMTLCNSPFASQQSKKSLYAAAAASATFGDAPDNIGSRPPTCPTCPPTPKCPTCPTSTPCPPAPKCPTCPTSTPCPSAPKCPEEKTCPTCPTCPTQQITNGSYSEENGKLLLKCPVGKINIVDAFYGRPSAGCKSEKSLSEVRTRCNGQANCEVPATNAVFGDPCQNYPKLLYASYQCLS